MINFGPVPIGAVLPIMFDSFAGSTGASITLTGLAVTDIEVYKGTSMTQRSSDAGYTLLDTDGIDLDGVTGIHGFSIDTGDNTDASFYAAGSFYTVVVSAVTIDSQTVNFVAATFRCVPAETSAGVPQVRSSAIADGAIAAATLASDTITAAKIADGAIDLATFAADAKALMGVIAFGTAQSVTGTTIRLASAETFADDEIIGATVIIRSATTGAGQARVITDYASATDTATVDTWTTTPTGTITYVVIATAPGSSTLPVTANVTQWAGTAVATPTVAGVPEVDVTHNNGTAITAASGIQEVKVASIAANAITATAIASDAITDAKVASDVTIASVTGAVGSVTGNVGGNVVGSVGSVTGAVGSVTGAVGSVTGLTASDVAAIKAKTDSLTFTVAGQVDANVQYVNDVAVTGTGAPGDEWGP